MNNEFSSVCNKVDNAVFPAFTGMRIMMMPLLHGDQTSIPPVLDGYRDLFDRLFAVSSEHQGKIVYVTIDEALVKKGETHRRPGLHVDGVYRGPNGSWGGGGGWAGGNRPRLADHDRGTGSWGGGGGWAGGSRPRPGVLGKTSGGTGMLVAANVYGCSAWNQDFKGMPNDEGGCEELRPQLQESARIDMKAGEIFWADGFCVHESAKMEKDVERQFLRLSLPSNSPWFEGYSENPLGVLPSGPILAKREQFMSFRQ